MIETKQNHVGCRANTIQEQEVVMKTNQNHVGCRANTTRKQDIVMKQSKIVETGLTDQVLDDPQHPYTQLLVSSVLQN